MVTPCCFLDAVVNNTRKFFPSSIDVQTDRLILVIFLPPTPSETQKRSDNATMAVIFQRAVRDEYKTDSSE
jgi:hypothetical protein